MQWRVAEGSDENSDSGLIRVDIHSRIFVSCDICPCSSHSGCLIIAAAETGQFHARPKYLFRNTLLASLFGSILCGPPGMLAKYKFFENKTLAIRG
jgi:hypothetical protein